MERLQEAVHFIRNRVQFEPEYGIILGTGLGNLVSHMDVHDEINYSMIPHFQVSTVESHSGKNRSSSTIGDKSCRYAGTLSLL
ncbi:MAG: hypothetical protein R2794_13220 [Chitinophagales bacterium]